MSPEPTDTNDAEMLDEYDFSDGVRGKYVSRFPEGGRVILLESDVAEVFPDSHE